MYCVLRSGRYTQIVFLVSTYVKRYNGLSAEALNSFVGIIDKRSQEDSEIPKDKSIQLKDFAKTLGDIFIKTKAENEKLRAERFVVDELGHTKKPRYFDGQDLMPREWIEEFKDAMEDNYWLLYDIATAAGVQLITRNMIVLDSLKHQSSIEWVCPM